MLLLFTFFFNLGMVNRVEGPMSSVWPNFVALRKAMGGMVCHRLWLSLYSFANRQGEIIDAITVLMWLFMVGGITNSMNEWMKRILPQYSSFFRLLENMVSQIASEVQFSCYFSQSHFHHSCSDDFWLPADTSHSKCYRGLGVLAVASSPHWWLQSNHVAYSPSDHSGHIRAVTLSDWAVRKLKMSRRNMHTHWWLN